MKQIEKGEIFQHLSEFLKTKGIELTEGSYSRKIEKSCGLLTETINLGQHGIQRARQGIDTKLDQVRQVIHEKTAPKPAAPPASATPPTSAAPPADPPPAGTAASEKTPMEAGTAPPAEPTPAAESAPPPEKAG